MAALVEVSGRVHRGRVLPEPEAHPVTRALAIRVAMTSDGGLAAEPGVLAMGGLPVVLAMGGLLAVLVLAVLVLAVLVLAVLVLAAPPTAGAMTVVRDLDRRAGPSEPRGGPNRHRQHPSFVTRVGPDQPKGDRAQRRRCASCGARVARRRRRRGGATRT